MEGVGVDGGRGKRADDFLFDEGLFFLFFLFFLLFLLLFLLLLESNLPLNLELLLLLSISKGSHSVNKTILFKKRIRQRNNQKKKDEKP